MNYKTKKNKMVLFSLFLISGLMTSSSQACVASRDPRMNYFVSYERPHAGLFADGIAVGDIRPTIIEKCKESTGQFLMVSLTVKTQKPTGKTSDISFTKRFKDDSCHIVNNPFPVAQTYDDKLKNFESQYDLLRACTYYDIVEIDDNELMLPEVQPAARVQVMSRNHIRAEGDFVYLNIRASSRFAIGIGIKKECTQAGTLKALGLQPGDVQALLNTYVAGDATGLTTDLTSISSTRVRFALTPGSELMEVSATEEPANIPSWPTTYKTGVEFGTLSIRNQNDDGAKLDFVPMVDNFGALACRNGICSSENSFQTPVSGAVELVDLTGPRRKVLDSWYFGANSPSQYQGLLESVSKYLDPGLIRVGRKYSVEMTLVDPYEDFLLFRSGLSQMLIELSSLGSVAGLDIVQSLTGLGNITGMRSITGFGGLNSPDPKQTINTAIEELSEMEGPQHWPAFFTKTCLGRGANCYTRGKVKFLKKIGADFTVGELQDDQTYALENLRIYSVDPATGFQVRPNQQMPKVDCSVRGGL